MQTKLQENATMYKLKIPLKMYTGSNTTAHGTVNHSTTTASYYMHTIATIAYTIGKQQNRAPHSPHLWSVPCNDAN